MATENIGYEDAVLSVMLQDHKGIADVLGVLGDEGEPCFISTANRHIYRAITDCFKQTGTAGLVMVVEMLRSRDQLEDAGGPERLFDLACDTDINNGWPSLSSVYAKKVRERDTRRRLSRAIGEAGRDLEVGLESPEAVVQAITAVVRDDAAMSDSGSTFGDEWTAILDDMDARAKAGDGMIGIPSGFHDLDYLACGFQPGQLVLLAGRPGMGKTAAAANMATYAAKRGRQVVFVTLEMSKRELFVRMLAAESGVSLQPIRRGQLSDDAAAVVVEAADRIYSLPLVVYEAPGLTAARLSAILTKHKAKYGLDMVVVDYLGLMRPSVKTDNRVSQITDISNSLKAIAGEFKVPLLALSQLSRAAEGDGKTVVPPKLRHLRDSGSLEQDADLVLMLFRPEVYFPDDAKYAGRAQLLLEKQRNGPLGAIKLYWDADCVRFRSAEREA